MARVMNNASDTSNDFHLFSVLISIDICAFVIKKMRVIREEGWWRNGGKGVEEWGRIGGGGGEKWWRSGGGVGEE